MVAWFPYSLVCIAEMIQPEVVPPHMAAAPVLLAKAAGIFNPLIYFLSSKKFCRQTKQLLKKLHMRRNQVQPVGTLSNKQLDISSTQTSVEGQADVKRPSLVPREATTSPTTTCALGLWP